MTSRSTLPTKSTEIIETEFFQNCVINGQNFFDQWKWKFRNGRERHTNTPTYKGTSRKVY